MVRHVAMDIDQAKMVVSALAVFKDAIVQLHKDGKFGECELAAVLSHNEACEFAALLKKTFDI